MGGTYQHTRFIHLHIMFIKTTVTILLTIKNKTAPHFRKQQMLLPNILTTVEFS